LRSETAFRFIDEAKQRFALQGKRNSVALYRRSETAWRFTDEAKRRGALQGERNSVSLYKFKSSGAFRGKSYYSG